MPLNKQVLDLYTDYLVSSLGGLTTSTELSKLTNQTLSNDKISRFLGGTYQEKGKLQHTEYTSKDLWKLVKKSVREYETENSYLVIDDIVEEKKYTDENEVNCYHFDHTLGRNVKGVNMLNFILVTPKNELLQNNFKQVIKNEVNFKYVLINSWFGSNETLKMINSFHKKYIVPLKSNRKLTLSHKNKLEEKWLKLDTLDETTNQLIENKPIEVWLEGLNHGVQLIKQVFINEDGSKGTQFLITNDFGLSKDEIVQHYKKRWQVEEYHKSIKTNLSLAKSPTKTTFTQINHFFCSIYVYLQLEILTKSTKITNHFQLKSKLYLTALQSAMNELEVLRKGAGCER